MRPVRLVAAVGGTDLRITYDNADVVSDGQRLRLRVVGGALACDGVETVAAEW
ncbi:MAG: hypothetical protein R3F59_30685 [Myxococcota bacterium]